MAKKELTNGVTVANAIMDKVEELKGEPIPNNVEVSVTRNYGQTADEKVSELIFKLFMATGCGLRAGAGAPSVRCARPSWSCWSSPSSSS